MTRTYTNQLLQMIEDGLLDKDTVIMACVKYMSEADVQDMMESNEFVPQQFEDEEEDEDQAALSDFNYVGSRHHY